MLALGADFEAAMRAANAARRRRGRQARHRDGHRSPNCATAFCRPPRSRSEEKIVFDWALLDERLAEWRASACASASPTAASIFCIPATSRLLAEARAACDRLVVGLNSDASVRAAQGQGAADPGRASRAEVLAALEAVDLVVVFEEDTPLELIRQVRPKVLVKGGDYRAREMWSATSCRGRRRRSDPGRSRAGPQHEQHRRAVGRTGQDRHVSRHRRLEA